MDRTTTDNEWEKWGRKDPYFGVLTDEKFRTANLTDEIRTEFFETGRQHAEHVVKVCREVFDPSFTPRRILDFGCGVGRLVVPFAASAQTVVGVDVSPAMLEEARRNCREHGLENVALVQSDDTLSQVEGEFDLVHSYIVLQHIDPGRGTRIFFRLVDLLAPGGVGAVHFTYGWRNQIPGPSGAQPAAPTNPLQKIVRRISRRVRRAFEKPKPREDPEMQMNLYDLDTVFAMIQRCGADRCFCEFTDHGGALGVFVFFRKSR